MRISLLMSTKHSHIFERIIQSRLEDLNRAAGEAVRFLEERGIGGGAVYLVHLAIQEMVSNVIKYGYRDVALHEIFLRLKIKTGEILLVLEDDGIEFNPLHAPEPDMSIPAGERDPGGLGILLIRRLIQKIEYERCNGRNRLAMRVPYESAHF